ncbi:sensor histidine kinase [Anaerobacillus alkalidiazotrophicus]|uniref:Sensor histidine kinase n=1 Tax=Anaerobacillus alkalidiazotrophicus TaxID=472963 RepID=A0A1S2MAG6_9BACI|nr:sensor histidine kinase [Anaerobacillus alkalidiazotrophicus]OIJ21570.1 sensor histidine kinase [Anaerobacillus alkalidiazotrophicus]
MLFSLRNRLFLIFTLLLTVPFIILSIIIPSWFTSIIKEQTQDLTIEMMDQYSLYVDSITTQAEDIGKQVLINETTQQWIKLENEASVTTDAERLMMRNRLRAQLSSIMINNSNGMSITVFLDDGTGTWGNHPSLKSMKWFKDFFKNDLRWVKSHTDPFQQYQEMREININSFLIPLYDMQTFKYYGIIKVNFPSSLLETALSKIKLGESGRVYLLDPHRGNILSGDINTPNFVLEQSLEKILNSHQEKGLIETNYLGEDYLVFFHKLSIGKWILFSEITKSELFLKINQIQKKLFLISALIFILTIIASFLLSSNIVSPLGKLSKAMSFIERGDFNGAKRYMPTIKSHNDEVGLLIKVFGQTIDRLSHLIKTEYEANIRRKDAEYKALLLQINPHFLNNTLEIIGGLAIQGKNKEVMNVSIHLGRMMRYSLNTNSDVVQLGEEINYIRNFTDILKVRFEDYIDIEIEEDPETKSFPIIKFIIQPLVENSVKYSFIGNTHAVIKIKTKKSGDQIFIIVEDSGVGISEESISDLNNTEENNEIRNVLDSKGTSIGLKNVLGRLRLYYGQNFSYKIQSEKNVGTRITLCIKVEKEDIHHERINH